MAAIPRTGRRAALVFTGTATHALPIEALAAHGWAVVGVDAVVEDPFTDAAELIASVDLEDIDVVLTSGGGSITAIAIAVLADVPLTSLGAVEPRRLEAIDAAIESGAAVHRPVGDLHVDGVRRLITGPIEIQSHRHVDARLGDVRTLSIPAHTTIRVTAQLPMNGHLAVHVDGHPSHRADRLRVTSPHAPARLVASPRAQSFTELDVRLHDRHLRELLLP
jgi:hypothetical protein